MSRSKCTDARPVFFDPTGGRWRRTILAIAVTILVAVGLGAFVTSQQLEPLWHASHHTAASYPDQLVRENHGVIPVVGDGLLTTVYLVEHRNGQAYLVEPFTAKTVRPITSSEAKTIGNHTAVMVRSGYLADRQMVLTFDDGPSKYTSQILDILKRNHISATFFVIGKNVVASSTNEHLLQREAQEGHTIGGHTFTHIDFDDHGSLRNREEIVGTQRIIRDIAGINSRIYRLPYSTEEENPKGILTAQQLGLQEVSFDTDTLDWRYGDQARAISLPKLDGQGHVVVMHDGGGNRSQTVAMLQRLIDQARAQHYTFVSLDSLLSQPYVPTATKASTNDQIAVFGLQIATRGWGSLLNSVMVYATTSTVGIMVLYVTLAWLRNWRLQRYATRELKDKVFPVSVVMPVHNEEGVLRNTLNNIWAAFDAYPTEAELLLVLNGCTDRSAKIARKFARRWVQLRVLTSPPGKANALNLGIQEARHRILVTIDADTKLQADTLPKLTRWFANKHIGAVAGHIKVGNNTGVLTAFQRTEYLSGICVDRQALGVLVAPGACTAYWLPTLRTIGGIEGDTKAEDFDVTLRLKACRSTTRRRVIMDTTAIAWTEVPETLHDLWTQRLRWTYGTLQVCWKHRSMLLRPRYGWQGMFLLPYTILSIVVSLPLLTLIPIGLIIAIVGSNWQGVMVLAAFATLINLVVVFVATRIAKETWTHLLIVPIYRFIEAPLRLCLLFVVIRDALKGSDTPWRSPHRTDGVVASRLRIVSHGS